jgi:hypothetical protein
MLDCPPPRAHIALSLREIIERIQSDPSFPERRRSGVLSSLRCLVQWLGRHETIVRKPGPADAALSTDEITRLIRSLAPAALGVSRKRLRNAASDLRFAFRFYEPTREHPAVSTEAVRALEKLIPDRFARITLGPLIKYLASTGTDPWCMANADAEAFREALLGDPNYTWPHRTARKAIGAWNREAGRNPLWPQITLSLPDTRSRWARPWTAFPPALEQAVAEFLLPAQDNDDLFGLGRAQLAPATVRAQKELLRLAASALADSGKEPASLTGLRDLCAPAAFRAALGQIAQLKGGVTSTVQNVAHVLRKLAKLSGALTAEEVAEVEDAHKNLRRRFKNRATPRMDRDQHVLDQLDDAQLVDALLALARRRVAGIRRSAKLTKRVAIQVQVALALDLLFCAPLRIKNLVALNLGEHFFRATLNGNEHMLIRTPGEVTKTGEDSEHILFPDATELLRLYVDVYRPLISGEPGDWLFPGAKGPHKSENTLGTQLSDWVRAELGIAFHPHLIRKIVTKIYADLDPGGVLEVMRRMLGHTSDAMLRKFYLQKRHRASQKRYAEALDGHRLRAFGRVRINTAARSRRG